MQHVNTGFYYGLNTLSSVRYHAALKTTGEERRQNKITIDSKELLPRDFEMIVSPLVSLAFFVSLSFFLCVLLFFTHILIIFVVQQSQ